MPSDLTSEFVQGFKARHNAGPAYEREPAACPYIATSNCADVWHAGFAHACNAMGGNAFARAAISRVWHGRGYKVNVQTTDGRLVYMVDYDRDGPALAYMVTQ